MAFSLHNKIPPNKNKNVYVQPLRKKIRRYIKNDNKKKASLLIAQVYYLYVRIN